MRRISNKEAVELARQGKASYGDGTKPTTLKSHDDLIKEMVQNIIDQTELDVANSNNEILMACDTIIKNMDTKAEPIDNKKLDLINDRMVAIMQMLTKPKEWDFEVERDMMGEITNVNAKQVIH